MGRPTDAVRPVGLSPRVRGNHIPQRWRASSAWSIPARAGEPTTAETTRHLLTVYPRACGGTSAQDYLGTPPSGLSPRVRGNHPGLAAGIKSAGSIPARAGEPRWRPFGSSSPAVYPRACGGTRDCDNIFHHSSGLSPRVRGNHCPISSRVRSGGSIPARAGEPSSGVMNRRAAEVYPRACGGTRRRPPDLHSQQGLSPRVRGNRLAHGDRLVAGGSIPARAGEPVRRGVPMQCKWVYPRACGGTQHSNDDDVGAQGLSPRVRGNRLPAGGRCGMPGSIPARAGEPDDDCPPHDCPKVYPRACGGTLQAAGFEKSKQGLSPRVRGNLTDACWI